MKKELVGLGKVVSDQSTLGKSNVGGILLDPLKIFVCTGTTEKRQKLVNVMIPKFDSAMTRHWLRIEKNMREHLDLLHHAQKHIDGSDGRS